MSDHFKTLDEWASKQPKPIKQNPLIKIYGSFGMNKKCADCQFLIFKFFKRKYFKCIYRGITRSVASDHRLKYDACSKFKERP